MSARLTHIGHPGGRRHDRTDQRGFALLITITLLAFLVLLLVSLASLTRVETQVASNNQQLAQARQNALLALNIALGQLQKYAGPDQRVTGTADLAGAASGVRLGNGTAPTNSTSVNGISNGLGKVQPGTRYWTGIWGNSNPSNPSQSGTIYEQTPGPVLLNWMVSGNETTTFNASTTADTFGQVTASNGGSGTTAAKYTPALAVTGLSTGMSGTDAVTINGSDDAILLVGPKTAGTDPAPSFGELAIDRYVIAPLVPITAPPGSVPGLSSTDAPTIGRYAYWIGDEGVKAKYNLADAYTANTDPTTDAKARYRLLAAQHNGIEQIGLLTGSDLPANFANYPGKDVNNLPGTTTTRIENTVSPTQFTLADTNLSAPNVKAAFHNLTTYSQGVLADSYNGGLRRDLTSDLEANSLATYDSVTPYEPATGKPIIPSAYSPTTGPNWDVLKSFYSQSLYTTSASANIIDVQAADATHAGVSPVITQVRLLVGLRKKPGVTPPTPAPGQALVSVVLMLGNPYTATLRSTGVVKFKLRMNQTVSGNTANIDNKLSLQAISLGSSTPVLLSKLADGTGLLDNITFTISNLSIPPGEAVCYTNSADTTVGPPSPGDQIPATDVPLLPGAPIVPAASATTSAAVAIDTGLTWKVGNNEHANKLTLIEGTPKTDSAPGSIVPHYEGSNCNLDYVLADASDNILTSVLGSDANAAPANMLEGLKDGTTPSYAKILILKLRPPSNASLLLPASTVRDWRTYSDYNLRAQSIITPGVSFKWDGTKAAPPYECNYSATSTDFSNDIDTTPDANGNILGFWGRSIAQGTTKFTQLFDVPRASRIGSAYEVPILSMGQLQHANLTADDENLNVGHQPGNAVGNSYFNPYVTRTAAKQSRTNRFPLSSTSTYTGPTTPSANLNYYDISYLLNCALWDRYFFSTTPPSTTGYVLGSALPNNRLKPISTAAADLANLRNGRMAASNLLIDGAFNINSTSVDAWSALLASTNKLSTSKENSAPSNAVFARSWNAPNPNLNSLNASAGKLTVAAADNGGGPTNSELSANEAYSGYRRLTPKQITVLAQAIVQQVRSRGPFVSLAHFINRTLAAKTDAKSMKGSLQAAIDISLLNGSVTNGDGEILVFNGIDTAPTPDVFIYADVAATSDFVATDWGSKSTGIPGWLTQADILQSLGPVLATRSDTFVIRTYGELRNPLDASTTVAPLARAWCEAVVQRLPEYVNPTNTAEKGNENADTALAADNQTFGRRFKIVSFRWLSPNDI